MPQIMAANMQRRIGPGEQVLIDSVVQLKMFLRTDLFTHQFVTKVVKQHSMS